MPPLVTNNLNGFNCISTEQKRKKGRKLSGFEMVTLFGVVCGINRLVNFSGFEVFSLGLPMFLVHLYVYSCHGTLWGFVSENDCQ